MRCCRPESACKGSAEPQATRPERRPGSNASVRGVFRTLTPASPRLLVHVWHRGRAPSLVMIHVGCRTIPVSPGTCRDPAPPSGTTFRRVRWRCGHAGTASPCHPARVPEQLAACQEQHPARQITVLPQLGMPPQPILRPVRPRVQTIFHPRPISTPPGPRSRGPHHAVLGRDAQLACVGFPSSALRGQPRGLVRMDRDRAGTARRRPS